MARTIIAFVVFLSIASSAPAQNTGDTETGAPLPKVTIYHLEGRRSERIVWLMEELGFDYNLEFKPGDLLGSMATIRSLGHGMPVAPTIRYGEQILVESGAIIEMIIARHAPGRLTPPIESPDFATHLLWMHYAEGSLAARLFSDYRVWMTNPPTTRSRLVDSEDVVRYAESFLDKHDWFGGAQFSTADIMMVFPLNVATKLGLVDEQHFPNVAAWKERIEARPAYKRMLAKARPNGIPGSLPKVGQRPPSTPR